MMPPRSDQTPSIAADAAPGLEARVRLVGGELRESMVAVLDALPGGPRRPQELVTILGIDKVLASRLLKAVKHRDPMAVTHLAPGPEPMRRLLRAASRRGVPQDVVERASAAVDGFEQLIRTGAGDRSALDTIISAWLPEARQQFELRRKQAAFRAMSELKGCRADINLATVILSPSPCGDRIDIVWLIGLLGLQRLRPDAPVKFATRRFADHEAPRAPQNLMGEPIEGMSAVRLDRFCDAPPAEFAAHRVGDATHYTLAGNEVGPRSQVDLMLVEVNLAEMDRFVPADVDRKGFVFAEVSMPSRVLLFDVLVHEQVYPGRDPELHLYDTVLDGVANVNDRTRDIDRMDMNEVVASLGTGLNKWRTADSPNHVDMISTVMDRMDWQPNAFRGYRCRIEYPLYGSQVVVAFAPPPPPA